MSLGLFSAKGSHINAPSVSILGVPLPTSTLVDDSSNPNYVEPPSVLVVGHLASLEDTVESLPLIAPDVIQGPAVVESVVHPTDVSD
ncbi:hypothetical protein K7X08_030429 [Anisodus acutangulus]|uniref:Uncharacterized protein n=1 Tax=Anisodus acutangulus TaxID=402998 RepID=A0A9Q1L5N1_9SOLA|nr:hypothetical protein K7X08_030429 [Anisodus acutangulus]